MGQALGPRQLEIAVLLLKRKQPLDADELAGLLYKRPPARLGEWPTKTQRNIVWRALEGMERRRMIQLVGKTHRGFRRWELTKQGRKDIEALKSTENVSVFPGS